MTEYSGAVVTTGVQSTVTDGQGDLVGHVALFDCDGGVPYHRFVDELAELPGFTITFESSPGSFHAWNTSVRSLSETAILKLGMGVDDDKHAGVGYRRAVNDNRPNSGWTMRITEKTRPEDGTVYKTAPEPRDSWYNETGVPQSRPHLRYVQNEFPELAQWPADVEMIGGGADVIKYCTMDDATKEAWRNDG